MGMHPTYEERAKQFSLMLCCGELPEMREGDYYESDPDTVSCRRCGRNVAAHGFSVVAKMWNEKCAKNPPRRTHRPEERSSVSFANSAVGGFMVGGDDRETVATFSDFDRRRIRELNDWIERSKTTHAR